MRKVFLSLVTSLLCIAMLLTSCNTTNRSTPGELENDAPAGRAAVGRYVESAVKLPENAHGQVFALERLSDGSLWLFGFVVSEVVEGGYIGEYRIWKSENEMNSWDRVEYPWESSLGEYSILHASIRSANEIYLWCMQFDSEGSFEYVLLKASDTQITPVDYKPSAGDVVMLQSIKALSSGNLMLAYNQKAEIIDPSSGRLLETIDFPSPLFAGGPFNATNDKIVFALIEGISVHDAKSGQQIAEFKYENTIDFNDINRAVDFANDGDSVYYADSTGVYKFIGDSSFIEKIVDGTTSSFGLPAHSIQRLISLDDESFLVMCYTDDMNDRIKLYKYSYEPDAPVSQVNEVRIYSLFDNRTIRQAISGYQIANPETKITYITGLSGDYSITASDAIRTLMTQLLAGDGPDIIILDGISTTSLIDQGVLLDISDIISPLVESGTLLSNISEAYKVDSAFYAIPSRFTVPVVITPDKESIKDLNSLSNWVNNQDNPQIGIPTYRMMEWFFDTYSNKWFNEDGAFISEQFTSDLQDIGRIAHKINPLSAEGVFDNQSSLLTASLFIIGEAMSASIASIHDLKDLALPYKIIQENPDRSIELFPDGGIYTPRAILGVNAAGQNIELSKDFVKHILSDSVQAVPLGDGLPINSNALKTNADSESDFIGLTSLLINAADGLQEITVELERPSDDFINSFIDKVKNIETKSYQNNIVSDMIVGETWDYLHGEMSIEDTLQALISKLDIYLAE